MDAHGCRHPVICILQDEKGEGRLPFARIGIALRCAGIQATDRDLKWDHKSHLKSHPDGYYSYENVLALANKYQQRAIPLRTLRKSFQEVKWEGQSSEIRVPSSPTVRGECFCCCDNTMHPHLNVSSLVGVRSSQHRVRQTAGR